jgi:hypothetical protein
VVARPAVESRLEAGEAVEESMSAVVVVVVVGRRQHEKVEQETRKCRC